MYNKLFAKILDSSIWLEPDPVRLVWITLLAAMDQDGYAHFSAVQNLAERARVSLDDCKLALEKLMAPDAESGIQENDGRRVERVPGGFIILNAKHYRDLVSREIQRENTRERVRRFRAKQKTVTDCNDSVTPSEAEASTEAIRVRGRATALPPDFDLTDAQVAYARGKGILDVHRELEAFKAHHLAHGKVMKDWGAAWRTWCLNFEKFGGKSNGKESRKLSATERVRQRSRSRIAEIDAELAQREADAGTVDPDGGHLRLPMGESVRGSR